jgi:hypothetical protein
VGFKPLIPPSDRPQTHALASYHWDRQNWGQTRKCKILLCPESSLQFHCHFFPVVTIIRSP